MAKRRDKNAECPYYRFDNGQRMSCEGVLDGIEATNLIFANRASLLAHRRRYCCRKWEDCPIARDINRKWSYEI